METDSKAKKCMACGGNLDERAINNICYLCQPDEKIKNKAIANKKFGLLTALYPTRRRKNQSSVWCCKCDCGNLCIVKRDNLAAGYTKSCGCLKDFVKDLTGEKFGKLTVLSLSHTKNGCAYWLCSCDCGNETVAKASSLINGYKKSCGCIKAQTQDLTGKKFGKLTAMHTVEDKEKGTHWLCKCDCGNTVTVLASTLLIGKKKSCGCLISSGEREDPSWFEGTRVGLLSSTPTIANSTGIRGVYFDKKIKKYRAYISVKKTRIRLGDFDKLEDAAKARARAEEMYFDPVKEKYAESKKKAAEE